MSAFPWPSPCLLARAATPAKACAHVRVLRIPSALVRSARSFTSAAGPAGGEKVRATRKRGPVRELPKIKSRTPLFLGTALTALTCWGAFAAYATNKERLASSVFASASTQLRHSPEVQRELGEPVLLDIGLLGDPWVSGLINLMQGKVDISFDLKGPKGTGKAYFTSIRRDKQSEWEIIRFKVITDAGKEVSLLDSLGPLSLDESGDVVSAAASASGA